MIPMWHKGIGLWMVLVWQAAGQCLLLQFFTQAHFR